jgi:flagellar motor component MotA
MVLGFLARKESLRKHVMHGAVLVGLIGVIGGGWRVVKALGSLDTASPIALGMNIAMAVICAVFVVLCVKSFINARRLRKQSGV